MIKHYSSTRKKYFSNPKVSFFVSRLGSMYGVYYCQRTGDKDRSSVGGFTGEMFRYKADAAERVEALNATAY